MSDSISRKKATELLEELAIEINSCRRCELWQTRKQPVPGEGAPDAKLMLIGEAPGKQEDLEGKPFVGTAGKILTEALTSAGLTRTEVFIGNVLKCRPPKNRNPNETELQNCIPFLDRQIAIIDPVAICPLGNFALAYIQRKYNLEPLSISKVHGKIYKIQIQSSGELEMVTGKRKKKKYLIIAPLYHPAALIYKPKLKPELVDTFKKVHALISKF